LDSKGQIHLSVMPFVLTEILSHRELTEAVQVNQVLVVSMSSTLLLLFVPFLANRRSETSSEGLLAPPEPALRDYASNQYLVHERQHDSKRW